MFESGESVRVIDDMAEVMKLQSSHGGWNDDMGCVRHTFNIIRNTIVVYWAYVSIDVTHNFPG